MKLIPKCLKGKEIRRVDFKTYKPLFNRGFIPANMELLLDSLIARNYSEPLRLAIMANVLHESGGDPNSVSNGKGYKGIIQWDVNGRYPNTTNMGKLIHTLLDTSENVSSPNWSHGGSGEPYTSSAKSAYNGFWNATDPYNATLYYSKGYVRPKEELARINRAKEALHMNTYLK